MLLFTNGLRNTTLMQSYVEKLKPRVGDAWRTDELYVKISGEYQISLCDYG